MGGRRLSALLVAGASSVGLLWTWLVAFGTDAGVRLDQRIYVELAERRPTGGARFAVDFTHLGDPRWFLSLGAGVLAVALVRRRWAVVAAAAILLVGANVTTQVLQELTAGHRHVLLMPRAYWPSGHTTAVVSVAVALVIAVPPALRVPAAILAVVTTAVMGWAVVVIGTHLPSDVLAAVFVCGVWASLAVAGLLLTTKKR